jgi:hypothetical protein
MSAALFVRSHHYDANVVCGHVGINDGLWDDIDASGVPPFTATDVSVSAVSGFGPVERHFLCSSKNQTTIAESGNPDNEKRIRVTA